MRRGIGAGIAVLLLLAICSVGAIRASATYIDPDGIFSFTLPDGYAVIPNGPIPALVTFGPMDVADATISIDAEAIPTDLGTPTTLDGLVMVLEESLASNYGTMTPGVEPTQTLTVGGEEARRVDFVQTEKGIRYHSVIFFMLHGDMLWSIIVRAEPNDYDTVVQQIHVVIDSFAFLSGAAGTHAPAPTIMPTATSMPTSFLRRLGER